jgi:outer membrane protein OmpA-like peptidoglycan-associated protein
MNVRETKTPAVQAKKNTSFFGNGAKQGFFQSSPDSQPFFPTGHLADKAVQRQNAPALPAFTVNQFVNQNFRNFDARYDVAGPAPATGTLHITHGVFLNFPKSMSPDEKSTFETNFMTSVHDTWSNKHLLKLNVPGFSAYQCNVDVTVRLETKRENAHTVINVVHRGGKDKRLRSRVTDTEKKKDSKTGHTAQLDSRDPTILKDSKLDEADFIQYVGNFDFDSAVLNSDCQDAIKKIKDFIGTIPPNPDPGECTFSLQYVGRASSEGGVGYNKALSQRRIQSVDNELQLLSGLCLSISVAAGKEEATEDPSFRRVNVGVFRSDSTKPKNASQNVAAHEFGHMIGLGDDYVETKPETADSTAKFFGDQPTHYDAVKDLVGKDAADELLIQSSDDIMSRGSEVKRGDYVFFAAALDAMTRPEIEQATGKPDAKWSVQ